MASICYWGFLLCYHAYCDCVPCSSYCCYCCCYCCCYWLLLLSQFRSSFRVGSVQFGSAGWGRPCPISGGVGGGRGEGDDTNYQLVLRLRLLRLLLLRQLLLLVLVGKSSCISTSTSSVQHRFPLRFLAFTTAISCLGFGSSNQNLLLGFRCQLSSPGRVLGLGSTACL